LEQSYRAAASPIGAVEDEIFRFWNELAAIDEDELFMSLVRNGILEKFNIEAGSVRIDSFSRQEWHKKLYNIFDLHELGKGIANPERSYHLALIVRKLARTGPYRRFNFEKDVVAKLSELRETAPNFVEVTEMVIDAVILATNYSRPIRISPILLAGEAGIGKTRYASELSRCLSVPIKHIAVDNLQEGAGLAGSSSVYSNSEPGEVFKVLAQGNHLSPIVILDEIDKAGASLHGDALAPLHSLLEPVSAKQFSDGSVGLPIDASAVIWIATANDPGRIPKTLLSRFVLFEIPPQDRGTRLAILKELCKEFEDQYAGIEFSEEALEALVEMTPREQRQLLLRALSRAVRLGEKLVRLNHLEQVAPRLKKEPLKRAIGYL
jgi:ATP-dependent Lon protease